MDGHGDKDRQEKLKKAYVVLPYMKGVMQRLQRAYKKHDISSYFAKLGTSTGMWLYTRRTLWTRKRNVV